MSSSPAFVFQARIAFLQGERKGQENLKNDLVRRIKMLEYALKQERFVMFVFFPYIAFLFIFLKTLYINVSFVNIKVLTNTI